MLHVAIVGAGVSGGVIARGLKAIPGVRITLVEQVSRKDHVNAGNGLNIGPNALKALDEVLPAMADELRAASLPWTRWKASLVNGMPLYETWLDDVADRPGIRIRWSELYGISRDTVADITHFEHRLTGLRYGSSGESAVAIEIEHVTSGARRMIDDIDLLIACDGRYSRVREQLFGAPPVRHLQIANFRLLTNDDSNGGIGDMEQWFNGPNRLLAYRLQDGNIYLSGTVPVPGSGELREGDKTADAIRRAYLPADGGILDVCRTFVEATCAQPEALHWSRMQEIPTCFRDNDGRVLFVGDSAHAMAPTLGQGATQAIEDGCAFVGLFARMFGAAGFSVPDLTAAFERLRHDRIDFVKRLSWQASAPMLAGSDPVASHKATFDDDFRADLRRVYLDTPFAQ
jgi:salicylate hydroxylase